MEKEGAPALWCAPHFATLAGSERSEVGLEGERKSKLRSSRKASLVPSAL